MSTYELTSKPEEKSQKVSHSTQKNSNLEQMKNLNLIEFKKSKKFNEQKKTQIQIFVKLETNEDQRRNRRKYDT